MPEIALAPAPEQDSALDDALETILREAKRAQNATAIASVKEALLQRVFPLIEQTASAARADIAALRAELLGDDEADPDSDDAVGAVDELADRVEEVEERVGDVEERAALLAVGLEVRTRLSSLARAVEVYAADRSNLVAEARDALAYVANIDNAMLETLREASNAVDAEAAQPAVEPEAAPSPAAHSFTGGSAQPGL